MSKVVKCRMMASDCHAYYEGACRCLSDSDFGIKQCPFYKKRSQNEAEIRAIKEGWQVPVSASKAWRSY